MSQEKNHRKKVTDLGRKKKVTGKKVTKMNHAFSQLLARN